MLNIFESSEAFARVGLVPTDGVCPKKQKTGERHQPGPVVEHFLGEGRGVRVRPVWRKGGA